MGKSFAVVAAHVHAHARMAASSYALTASGGIHVGIEYAGTKTRPHCSHVATRPYYNIRRGLQPHGRKHGDRRGLHRCQCQRRSGSGLPYWSIASLMPCKTNKNSACSARRPACVSGRGRALRGLDLARQVCIRGARRMASGHPRGEHQSTGMRARPAPVYICA